MTVSVEEGKVTVARILIDSIIDKQGLLRPGDVIVEANGQKIKNPEQLQQVLTYFSLRFFTIFYHLTKLLVFANTWIIFRL